MTETTTLWDDANQRYLTAAVEELRERLTRHARSEGAVDTEGDGGAPRRMNEARTALPAPAALETLAAGFGLSPFERDILLLCAAMELDSSIASLCAAAQNDPSRLYPTFSLALSALTEPHWSALSPDGPLRYWRLIEVLSGSGLTASPLQIDERVLHYLAGVRHLDERLVGYVEPLRAAADLVPSHQRIAEQIVSLWSDAAGGELPAVQLCGSEVAAKRAIAGTACATLGMSVHVMPADALPSAPAEIESLLRLWEREAVLSSSALLLDGERLSSGDASRVQLVQRAIERVRGPVIVSSRERADVPQRASLALDVRKPTTAEQAALWRLQLDPATLSLNGTVDLLVSQFGLGGTAIRSVAAEAVGHVLRGEDQDPVTTLWDACRRQARPRLDDLAQRIEPAAGWDDLILPGAQTGTLREIAAHVRQRATVYESWGFAGKGARGLGISALFAGVSGTGKTMAAEVLAGDLRLDLYRIDLSSVVSKYIGETEKNLRRIFDAAEEGGAILLFDEADALFGKRSEVKDSHDRYANIEISYLLQRMEAYRGLAILTTNLKNALDPAFLRRIRFIVQFPFPDAMQREEIWRRIFPAETPVEALDVRKLSRLNVAGGSIRNIALNAAFLAADAAQPVGMRHLAQAARSEYTKLERALTEGEIGGWV